MSATVPGESVSSRSLYGIAARRMLAANRASEAFFADNAERVACACHAMALRFQAGGRLLVGGDAAQQSDVAHVVVEFVHPVIVGKRALPAIAVPANPDVDAGSRSLELIARPGDILMTLHAGAVAREWEARLASARARGLLTVTLTGRSAAAESESAEDIQFAVPSHDPCIVQETHEMLYHVLWELVHVFFEHRAVQT